MTAALSPDQAIAYVRELSADVRAVAVLDARGAHRAGDPVFGAAAAALVAALPAPASSSGGLRELVARDADGVVFAAVTATHAVVAVAGPLSLSGPTALDVRAAARALAGDAPAAGPQAPPPEPTNAPEPALDRAIRALKAAA